MLDRPFARCLAAGLAFTGVLCAGCVSTGGAAGETGSVTPSWLSGVTGGGAQSANGGGGASAQAADLSPAERRMRDQSQAFQKTVWQGALIGAGAGALWGAIRGDDAQDILKKALIGGAVGGLAGAYVGHKQKQYSNKEDQLDSMIADVRESNKATEDLIVSVREVIAEDKRRLADVEKRYKAGKASEADVKSTRARIADNKAVVAQATKGAREKYSMFQGAEETYRKQNPGTDTAGLQRELKAYNRQIETLDGLADTIKVA